MKARLEDGIEKDIYALRQQSRVLYIKTDGAAAGRYSWMRMDGCGKYETEEAVA